MNATLLHRRRVERFAQLLDEAEGARRHHSRSALDEELSDLLDVGYRLGDIKPQVTMPESRRAEIRADLMAEAVRNGIGVTAKPEAPAAVGRARVGVIRVQPTVTRKPFARRVRARGAILVGLAVGTLAISGIATASGDSMPGDTLYGLKRSQEQTELALAGSQASKGQLYLTFASRRFDEAMRDSANVGQFDSLVKDMSADTNSGIELLLTSAYKNRDRTALGAVTSFYSMQSAAIKSALDQMSGSDPRREALRLARYNLDLAGTRAGDVQTALACSTVVATTGSDQYGPKFHNPICSSGLAGTPPGR